MNDKLNKGDQRLVALDGLKGISLITIIIYYFYEYLLPGGYLAVNMFLLIAGFLNFRHFYRADQVGLKIRYRKYYQRRFNRLFFPMLAMMVSVGSFILLFARDFLLNLRNMGLSSLLFVNNYYQIINEQSYFVQAANPSVFQHLWYVSLLGQLVLATPLLMILFYYWHRKASITINMLLIVTILSAVLMAYLYQDGTDPSRIYYDLLTRAFAYTAGGILGLFLPLEIQPRNLSKRSRLVFNMTGMVVLIILFFMVKFMYGNQPFAYRYGMSLFTLFSGIFIVISLQASTIWHQVVKIPLFTFIGKRSYSYYLWFYPIYLLLPSLLQNLHLASWLITLMQLILIVILAEISYRIFERKTIRLALGQSFNISAFRRNIAYLLQNKERHMRQLVLTIAYLFLLALGGVAILAAPEERNNTAQEIEEVITNNQAIAERTQMENTTEVKIINNIEGLSQQEMLYANGLDVTFIGDSILGAAAAEIQTVFPKAVIAPTKGLQLYNSASVAMDLAERNLMRPSVVTILGSNGTFTSSQIDDYIAAIGSDRDIYFVTSNANRAWVSDANSQLLAAAQRHGNVYIIDWNSIANDQGAWIYEDGAHPTKLGAENLAIFIAKEIYRQR